MPLSALPADRAGRDWLDGLTDDLLLLVCKGLRPGPLGRHDFRQLCQRARRLANTLVVKAHVESWNEAAQMATRFPQLEELTVRICTLAELEGARAFLQHSAPQLTRLVSVEISEWEVPLEFVQHLCRSMPQLQRLGLPVVKPAHPPPELGRALVLELSAGLPELAELLPRMNQLLLQQHQQQHQQQQQQHLPRVVRNPLRQLQNSPSQSRPVLEVMSCITQLSQLTALKFEVRAYAMSALLFPLFSRPAATPLATIM